jgi:hypothetical protein
MKDMAVIAEQIIAAAKEHSGKRGRTRSPLFDMMWDQYETLAPHLGQPRTPNWSRVAAVAAVAGMLDGAGQAPTARTMQKTWAKVERARDAADGAGGVRRRRGPPASKPLGDVQPDAPRPAVAEVADGDDNPYGFRPAGNVKRWTQEED